MFKTATHQQTEALLGRWRETQSMAPDFAGRQQVEGFDHVLSQAPIEPSPGRRGPRPMPDWRGPTGAATTREWWRPRPEEEPDLVWQTAPVPEAIDTTFTFAGASANLPDNAYPPNQATLYADGQPAIVFDLGQVERRVWIAGAWALEFNPRLAHTTTDGFHRQLEAGGVAGLYRLAAPASALTVGQPLRLTVVLGPLRTDAAHWFAVLERRDVLEVSPHTNAEQIEQLQAEVLNLKQTVASLARRAYPELQPERIPTEDVVIYTDGRHHVHQTDVELLDNGDLLVTFRDGSEHLSCDGKIATVRSTDNGRTWDDYQVVRAHANTDERESSIVQLRDGTLLMNAWINGFYDKDGRYLAGPSPTYQGEPAGVHIGRSTDQGRTWTWLSEQPIDPSPFPHMYTSERILELPSGALLMATYFTRTPEGEAIRGCALYRSEDRGQTWRYASTMASVPGMAFGEPALTRTKSGRLIGMLRNETTPEYYQVISADEGQTWSQPAPSGIPGLANPASLLPLPDGTILCIYGSRRGVRGMYVVASYDDGETWDITHRRVIRDDFPNFDIGYPSSVLLPDGRVLATYYFNMFECYFIAGSFFRWEAPTP